MPELADLLADVARAAAEVRTHEHELEEARERFRAALRAAHAAGCSYALLGRAAGLTRQRIARIIAAE
jgi:hypothetical protein